MKILKINDLEASYECPFCGEINSLYDEIDYTEGDIVKCSFCGNKMKLKWASRTKQEV